MDTGGFPLRTWDLLQRAIQEVSVSWPPRLKWVHGRGGTSMGIALTQCIARNCGHRQAKGLQTGQDGSLGYNRNQRLPSAKSPLAMSPSSIRLKDVSVSRKTPVTRNLEEALLTLEWPLLSALLWVRNSWTKAGSIAGPACGGGRGRIG